MKAGENGLSLLRSMVRIDSQTGTSGEATAMEWIHDRVEQLGLEISIVHTDDGRPNIKGVWRGTSPKAPTLLFNGHVDTNPVANLADWTVDPWGGKCDEHFIYGLGVANMKAGCISYLEAVRQLTSSGFSPRGDVVLTFVVGELQGGVGTKALLADGLTADYFINCEPTDLAALTRHAGCFEFVIDIVGTTRHVSKREHSKDALFAAALLIADETLRGQQSQDDAPHHPLCDGIIHFGSIRAGLGISYDERRPALISDRARVKGTCRYHPSTDAGIILERLENRLDDVERRTRTKIRYTMGPPNVQFTPMAAFQARDDSSIVRRLNAAHESVCGTKQRTGEIYPFAYYGTDAGQLAASGMEGVVCGPGGQFNTMPDERVNLNDFAHMISMNQKVLVSLGDGSEGSP